MSYISLKMIYQYLWNAILQDIFEEIWIEDTAPGCDIMLALIHEPAKTRTLQAAEGKRRDPNDASYNRGFGADECERILQSTLQSSMRITCMLTVNQPIRNCSANP